MRSRLPRQTKMTLFALARVGMVAAGLALAGCQTDGPAPFAETARRSPVAFEQIDGLPRTTFDQLVASLGPAADAHDVHVVSRKTDAPYRVKGYLSLQKEGSKTAISYAWDVFDRDGARVTRLTGEEPLKVARGTSDPWTACDGKVLDKIADRTMADLAETLTGGGSGQVAAATGSAGSEPEAKAQGEAPNAPQAAPQSTPTRSASALLVEPAAGASSVLSYAAR